MILLWHTGKPGPKPWWDPSGTLQKPENWDPIKTGKPRLQ